MMVIGNLLPTVCSLTNVPLLNYYRLRLPHRFPLGLANQFKYKAICRIMVQIVKQVKSW